MFLSVLMLCNTFFTFLITFCRKTHGCGYPAYSDSHHPDHLMKKDVVYVGLAKPWDRLRRHASVYDEHVCESPSPFSLLYRDFITFALPNRLKRFLTLSWYQPRVPIFNTLLHKETTKKLKNCTKLGLTNFSDLKNENTQQKHSLVSLAKPGVFSLSKYNFQFYLKPSWMF